MTQKKPIFQKRHYEAVAKILRNNRGWSNDGSWSLACSFTKMFANDNPLFDRKRFMNAIFRISVK